MPESRREVPAGACDPVAAIAPGDVRVAAMDLLARREHSRRELRQKLLKRFNDSQLSQLSELSEPRGLSELIEEQLDRLADENLQSDARYAASFLRQRSNRGYGPLRIRQEMRQKGISDAEIEAAMAAESPDWYALAETVYRKKFSPLRGEHLGDELKEKARRLRFLQYRGFAEDHFRHLLEN